MTLGLKSSGEGDAALFLSFSLPPSLIGLSLMMAMVEVFTGLHGVEVDENSLDFTGWKLMRVHWKLMRD